MTTYRNIQTAGLDAPLVFVFLVGPHLDADLRAALPGCEIHVTAEAPLQPVLPVPLAGRRVVAIGFSAGCQSVRALLWSGLHPVSVVTIDGTHASKPPTAAQIDVWRLLAGEARRGERQWVATATQQLYVEDLPTGAFAATRHVLEAATGEQLPAGAEVHDRDLHVVSYPSARIDKQAHIDQQRKALPDMLRRYVAPYLGASNAPGVIEPPAPPPIATKRGAEVPRIITPTSEQGLLDALHIGHVMAFGVVPSLPRLRCAWAQNALELERGKTIRNNNIGNITTGSAWTGDFYSLHVPPPDPPVLKFRAHSTLDEGAADYWRFLATGSKGRFAAALPMFDAGKANDAAVFLGAQHYYLADVGHYSRGMALLYAEAERRALVPRGGAADASHDAAAIAIVGRLWRLADDVDAGALVGLDAIDAVMARESEVGS